MGTSEIVYLILSLIFLFVCAFFSSAEIGFIKLQRIRLKHLQEEGIHGAERVAKIMEQPSRFLSTVLTGISFAETIVVALGTIFIVALLGEGIGTPVAIVVIALLLLIFAKVIPKTIAAQHPERIALPLSKPIDIISKLFYPLVIVLSWIAGRFTHIAHSSTMPKALISKEELGTVIDMGEEEGVVDEASAEMLRRVVGLGEHQVWRLMTPRTEATWLEQGITLSDFLKTYAESPAQRYPIYEGSYDNVEGMVSTRDVLAALAKRSINRKSIVTDLSRSVYFIPRSKTVGELLGEMRAEGYLMAVVLNEYGGTSGIVTIDQLIEHIAGEIEEELAGAKKAYEVVGARTYKIQGSTRIEEVNEELQLGIPEGDYQTVGGYALNLFGRLPKEGEQTVDGELKLLVAEVKDNKITRVFITKEKRKTEPGTPLAEGEVE
ncbi:MAG: hypothetical protein AMJ37_03555 [Dehalococcoidia bacterium DG_18]|nr:MAG: hypothetical protein AMJ37_03555 [Dehalococcoidia bacterium DG_18]